MEQKVFVFWVDSSGRRRSNVAEVLAALKVRAVSYYAPAGVAPDWGVAGNAGAISDLALAMVRPMFSLDGSGTGPDGRAKLSGWTMVGVALPHARCIAWQAVDPVARLIRNLPAEGGEIPATAVWSVVREVAGR